MDKYGYNASDMYGLLAKTNMLNRKNRQMYKKIGTINTEWLVFQRKDTKIVVLLNKKDINNFDKVCAEFDVEKNKLNYDMDYIKKYSVEHEIEPHEVLNKFYDMAENYVNRNPYGMLENLVLDK